MHIERQFLFRGNVTLTADATATYAANGIVQGIFLDDAPVANTILMPPTGLHIDFER